jgi:hypothetical protein
MDYNKASRDNEEKAVQKNLWNELLANTVKMEDKDANILVLGNFDSAKRSLIQAIEKQLGERVVMEYRNEQSVLWSMKDKKNICAFDYSYVSIKNPKDENSELAKVNFWVLNEKMDEKILKQILHEKRLKKFMVLIVLDFEKMSNLEADLLKWFDFINKTIAPVFRVLDLKDMDNLKNKMHDLVVNYTEPVKSEEGKILNKKTDINPDLVGKLDLPEGALKFNLGFPIMVAVNKSDYIIEIRKEKHPDEIFEMIEYTMRYNSVAYSAGVVYTSPKMGTNIAILADYLKYLLFGLPNEHRSNTAKECLFLPVGMDNITVVQEAYANISTRRFNDVIPKKEEQSKHIGNEFKATSNRIFLHELKEKLNSTKPETGAVDRGQPGAPQQGPRFGRDQREKILNLLNRNAPQNPAQPVEGANGNPGPTN